MSYTLRGCRPQVLAQVNNDRAERIKAKGSGRGGGSAPVLEDEYTIHEVIQIVERAKRSYLDHMENH